jgi:O-acetylserine/cysteine efflux transporter
VPDAARHLSAAGVSSLAFIAYVSTLVGFGVWGWLMRRYEAGTVAMYSLLVPPFGLLSAALVLGEHVDGTRLAGAALIICGVAAGSVRLRSRAGRASGASGASGASRGPIQVAPPEPVQTR